MKYIFQNFKLRKLYIFFLFLAVLNVFFSTGISFAKTFSINDLELSTPFKINFNKNKIIDEGFVQAFNQLMLSTVQSKDHQKLKKIPLNQIKSMIETFSIKEEKFVNEIYYIKLNVSFNKKIVFDLLEKKNIFPSLPVKKDIIFMPIVVDQNESQIKMFSDNIIYNQWNSNTKQFELLNYILPTEDLEDLQIIKDNYELIEQYNFNEITNKYYLKDSIIALIFKNEKELRVLSRITVKDTVILKNQTFSDINLKNIDHIHNLIKNLKLIYEDYWKNSNQINTSIKLALNIKINNSNKNKIDNFEKNLNQTDLIYDFFITKFDSKFTFYQIIFNGTPDSFLKIMNTFDYDFDTQNKIWILK